MIVTIHRVEFALYHMAVKLLTVWHEYGFEPSPRSFEERPPSGQLVRERSVPVEVLVPIGSKLRTNQHGRLRLATWFDAHGLDAESVYQLARRGDRGFGLAGDAASAPKPNPALVPIRRDPPAPELPIEQARLEMNAKAEQTADILIRSALGIDPKWGVEFRSVHLPTYRTLLARSSAEGGPIRSTRDPAAAATWILRENAEDWLAASGLGAAGEVPIGSCLVRAAVVSLADVGELLGVEFELPPSRGFGTPRPAPARASQAAFSFTD